MSPVIRITDSTYKRLENHAIGFDVPNNVIERLIDFYESRQSNSKKTDSEFHKTIGKSSNLIKKRRDPEKEKQLREAVGKALNWGKFRLVSNTVLEYLNSPQKVLCKYSSYSPEQDRWFWGVGHKYWSEWDDDSYLALLMGNKDQTSYSFLLLKPKEALCLFPKCSEHGGEKKINLRVYKSDGKLHFQEWQDYDVENNIQNVNKI